MFLFSDAKLRLFHDIYKKMMLKNVKGMKIYKTDQSRLIISMILYSGLIRSTSVDTNPHYEFVGFFLILDNFIEIRITQVQRLMA